MKDDKDKPATVRQRQQARRLCVVLDANDTVHAAAQKISRAAQAEHLRQSNLAQLGARVLESLRTPWVGNARSTPMEVAAARCQEIEAAARSLGLLDAVQGTPEGRKHEAGLLPEGGGK